MWGERTINAIARATGRAPGAVTARAYVLELDTPNRSVGALTLRGLSNASGFSCRKIRNAAEVLGINLKRGKKANTAARTIYKRQSSKNYAIAEDQCGAIIAYLEAPVTEAPALPMWGTASRPPACVDCGTVVRAHIAHGQCGACYQRAWKRRC